jgi:hypothetical protein
MQGLLVRLVGRDKPQKAVLTAHALVGKESVPHLAPDGKDASRIIIRVVGVSVGVALARTTSKTGVERLRLLVWWSKGGIGVDAKQHDATVRKKDEENLERSLEVAGRSFKRIYRWIEQQEASAARRDERSGIEGFRSLALGHKRRHSPSSLCCVLYDALIIVVFISVRFPPKMKAHGPNNANPGDR